MCLLRPVYSDPETIILPSEVTVVRGMRPRVLGCLELGDCNGPGREEAP